MNKKNKNGGRILFGNRARDIARDVVEEVGEGEVGDYLGASSPRSQSAHAGAVAIHRFQSLTPGYQDWEWVAVLATVPGSGEITVNEVSLQAGAKAELAPAWVPYEDRVRPGDLGPGDSLPPREDDDRLASRKEDGEPEKTVLTLGFPRNPQAPQVLTEKGLTDALTRWRTGDYGPNSEFAEAAPMTCRTCAFYLPFNSPETHFGVCANEFVADGRVVHESYGCGAHAETKEDFDSTGGREYGAFEDGF